MRSKYLRGHLNGNWFMVFVNTATALVLVGFAMHKMFDGSLGDMLWAWVGSAAQLFVAGLNMSAALQLHEELDALVTGTEREAVLSLAWGGPWHRTHDISKEGPGKYRCECASSFEFWDEIVVTEAMEKMK